MGGVVFRVGDAAGKQRQQLVHQAVATGGGDVFAAGHLQVFGLHRQHPLLVIGVSLRRGQVKGAAIAGEAPVVKGDHHHRVEAAHDVEDGRVRPGILLTGDIGGGKGVGEEVLWLHPLFIQQDGGGAVGHGGSPAIAGQP